jgi:hypothetical protein
MQALVNFASFIGWAIAVFLPTLCYLAALALFLLAGWGFWMQARPENPFRGRPWLPLVSLVLCGVFASFDQILTKANATAGTNVTVSIAGLTSYTAPDDAGNVLGNTPADAIVNVVQIFQGFFQSFGALMCFFAAVAWHGAIHGRSNRSQSGCLVQFVFGVMLINIVQIVQWLTQELTA